VLHWPTFVKVALRNFDVVSTVIRSSWPRSKKKIHNNFVILINTTRKSINTVTTNPNEFANLPDRQTDRYRGCG